MAALSNVASCNATYSPLSAKLISGMNSCASGERKECGDQVELTL